VTLSELLKSTGYRPGVQLPWYVTWFFTAHHYRIGVSPLCLWLKKRATQGAGIITEALVFFNALMKALSQIHMDHAFSAINEFSLLRHGGLLCQETTLARSYFKVLILINLHSSRCGRN
jgi:hypothetical protein